jgi:NADH-quinone oxidoreductase subunit K
MATLNHYLILSGVLFSIGTAGVVLRRNLITILLSIEVMLNAVNLTFVAVDR